MMWRRSRTATERPPRARYAAAVRPLWPPPMISASHFLLFNVAALSVMQLLLNVLRHISSSRWKEIILGSSSKARREILAEMGYEFTIMSADIDEKSIRREKPEDLVVTLAEAKADAIVQRLLTEGRLEEDASASATLLITADTVVVYRGMIREKPTSEKEAREFVKGYSGSHAAVVGSVVVTNLTTGKRCGGWESAEVYFHEIPEEVIDNLIDDGVTFNVAGGLMLEHPLTLPFVDAVVGSSDTVMGLSKALTEKLILEAL